MVVSPGDEDEVNALLARVARGESVTNCETSRRRKDGQKIDVLLTVAPISYTNGFVLGAATIANDVTERKRAEAAVTAATKELEAFSFSVSHDLRAPLRIVDGFTRILVEDFGPQLPEDAKRLLQIVRDGTVQMGQLIDDLLDFSRLGRQPLRVRTLNPREVVDDVLSDMSAEIEDRLVELTIESLPPCEADRSLLKQVFVNLIGNAFKYTRGREPAKIEIGTLPIDPESPERTYFIKDNGVGFDMNYASHLFGVFQRLHKSEDFEGTGVGLALVQRIVHRHGGRIWAEALVDQGATFWFTLPAPTFFEPPSAEQSDRSIAELEMSVTR